MSKNVVIFGENHWSMSKNPDVYGKPWGMMENDGQLWGNILI